MPPTTEQEVEQKFSGVGRITDVWLARKPPGFAFVWFQDLRDAEDACRQFDGTDLNGQKLRVEISNARAGPRRGPPRGALPYSAGGYGGGGGGYGGGYGAPVSNNDT
jgi:RNA recognition motif-containing protein